MITVETLQASLGVLPMGPVIGGETRAGDRLIDVLDPSIERSIAHVADATVADAQLAADTAAASLAELREASPRRRSEMLRNAFRLMTERSEPLARLITLENGKAIHDARAEVTYAAEFFRWYSEEAVRVGGTFGDSPSGSNRILVRREPIGVALLVTPWNFPAAMATRKIAPAIAAGCPVILKPAEETPLTALALARILLEAGVPAGAVNVLPSTRAPQICRQLLGDGRVRKLSFTGSTQVGRTLLETAAAQVVSCSMELGGNAPFLVLPDTVVEEAVAGAMVAKFRNGGSACTAANRFFVHSSVVDEFAERFAAQMRRLVVGPGIDEATRLGPLVNARTRDKVSALVAGALRDGAHALVGGSAPDRLGYFFDPTLLVGVAQSSSILVEEIFGPVAPVVAYDDVDEAVQLANATEYGLAAYVYSGDLRRGLQVAERLDCGMVGLNRGVVSDPAAPFGGTKQSGLGREGGHEGILEFTEQKYIAVEW